MANWPPQITVRSHRRDWWKKYHPEGNLYVVIVAYHEFSYIVSCWHSRVNTTWGTSAVPTARPPLHSGSNSHHKIRCWHAACLMEKAYLCWYRCPPFLSVLRLLYTNFVVEWAYTYAMTKNVSHCWVCTEFPFSTYVRLPWCIHATDVTAWDQLTHWGPRSPDWTVIHTQENTQRTWHGLDKPLLGYVQYMMDSHGWLVKR